MSWIKNTGCKYHTQDTGYYCGAACAMMVLAEIGVPYSSLDQDDLYTSNHNHNVISGWYTDPEGLRFTMVDRKPASFSNTFVIFRHTTEAASSQKLVYTLQHYGVSAIVLVFGCAHWIVVCGVQTDVNPATGPYVIDGFWVNNSVAEDNEPHASGDACGTGGTHGVENQWISYASWQSTYLTGCAYDSVDGSLQYLSVCDPDAPNISLPRRVRPTRYFDGRTIAKPGRLPAVLREEFKRHDLVKARPTARLVRGKLAAPFLVERMGVEAQYYYLVPLLERDSVVGFAQMDARFGNLQSAFPLRRPIRPFENDVRAVEKRLVGQRVDLPKEAGRIILRRGEFRVENRLVWRPCREAFSPHLPFWRITAGAYTLYQRVDGPLFSALTASAMGD